MHNEVKQFIKKVRRKHTRYFFGSSVLEVGSLNINGTVRKFFWFCKYWGIDLLDGEGVDMVCPIRSHKQPREYDVVISTEMLEHDKDWKESLRQMYENLKDGGLLILTCASTMRPEHGTTRTTPQDSPFTTDYYRNISISDFTEVLPPDLFTEYFIGEERNGQDLMFYGLKTVTGDLFVPIENRYKGEFVKQAI